MSHFNLDVFYSYDEANEFIRECGNLIAPLDPDIQSEDMILIVGSRKWSYNGLEASGPRIPGLDCVQHITMGDKYDFFIFERG